MGAGGRQQRGRFKVGGQRRQLGIVGGCQCQAVKDEGFGSQRQAVGGGRQALEGWRGVKVGVCKDLGDVSLTDQTRRCQRIRG